jgi:acyl-CoA reductase-like NAD-dependent aldehyde dehydrogenase
VHFSCHNDPLFLGLGVVIDGSELVDQEQFSPILPIIRVTDAEDALKHVNSTGYGLCGSVE